MKVKFLTRTRHQGKLVEPGETAEVNEATAKRWQKNGIAEKVKTQPKKVKEDDKKGGE